MSEQEPYVTDPEDVPTELEDRIRRFGAARLASFQGNNSIARDYISGSLDTLFALAESAALRKRGTRPISQPHEAGASSLFRPGGGAQIVNMEAQNTLTSEFP